ncbi:MAG: hypothetical protein J6V63_05780 [Spirochaetaceae bacterium]|nr:hypothetical protein [Spirochaetaceae bacterium]
MINYIIGFGVAALVIFLVVRGVKRKGQSSGCGCGCSSCSSFSSCNSCSSTTAPSCHQEQKES